MSEKFVPAESDFVSVPDAAMADAAPAFGEAPEVDLSGMPALSSLKKLLPGKRNRLYSRVLGIAEALPEGFFERADNFDAASDAGNAAAMIRDVAGLQESVEEIILSLAVDPAEMEAWIVGQEDPDLVEMAIFEQVMSELGE